MIELAALPPAANAAALIGAVLVEAMVLYVGYGGLTSALGPRVKRAIGGE